MEVVNGCAALLTNQEVLVLLSDIQAGTVGKKPNYQQQNLATICYETVKYLEKTPCKTQDSEFIREFTKKLQPFNLTKAEILQLLNHLPTTGVEIQLLVEESEERLTEQQTDDLLNIIEDFIAKNSEEVDDTDQNLMDQS